MACELCQPHEKPCRHEAENSKPSLSSLEASAEAKALIAELDNVLRCDQLWGIAEKHLRLAYESGRDDGFIAGVDACRSGHDA